MNELNEEIKLTLNLMQTVNDECAYASMQKHLDSLLEIKRNEIQQRLVERSWFKSAKPLTTEDLEAGGWWCADVSKECANALKSKHLRVFNSDEWEDDEWWNSCALGYTGSVTRGYFEEDGGNKQIHRIGNEFYWSEV